MSTYVADAWTKATGQEHEQAHWGQTCDDLAFIIYLCTHMVVPQTKLAEVNCPSC